MNNEITLRSWIKESEFTETTFAAELTKMGTPVSQAAVNLWINNETIPKPDVLTNIEKITMIKAEIFFLTKSDRYKIKRLLKRYSKEEAINILFDSA